MRIGGQYEVALVDPESITQSTVDPVAGRLRFNIGSNLIRSAHSVLFTIEESAFNG